MVEGIALHSIYPDGQTATLSIIIIVEQDQYVINDFTFIGF
jgi:hypothetical protein